jgi:cytochrome P450
MSTDTGYDSLATAAKDDRKSAALAAQHVQPQSGATVINSFLVAREILRNGEMKQAGASAEAGNTDLTYQSVFFLDGEEHKKRRSEISKFFTPKAIATRHRIVMERTADELLKEFRADGTAKLDEISFRMTVAVAAEIVGLTESDQRAMAKHIQATLLGTKLDQYSGFGAKIAKARVAAYALRFMFRDVRPAIASRRKQRREDVISHLLDHNYPDKAILIECITYAVAGMVTTREFIVMAAWHLFDRPELRARFVAAGDAEQTAILEEILRLEPVAAMLHRRATGETEASTGPIATGDLFALSIRQANVDQAVVGECPFALDPDRAEHMKTNGGYMTYGDGQHRCPGAQVAVAESRVFLDRLMKVPGLRLTTPPTMTWNDGIMSYELRDAIVTCDRG